MKRTQQRDLVSLYRIIVCSQSGRPEVVDLAPNKQIHHCAKKAHHHASNQLVRGRGLRKQENNDSVKLPRLLAACLRSAGLVGGVPTPLPIN